MIVLAYLAAIVAANVATATFGPSVSVLVAFLFVGFDLSLRDTLHERWRSRYLWPRMLALVVSGGAISLLFGAGPIAIASTVAFVAAGLADAIVYHALGRRRWLERANASNTVGAAVDSLVFPTLAFGALLPLVIVGQFAAKVAGGALWAYLLRPRLVLVG